ncbi:MAG: multidrug transporter subunit MdtA, partial [Burkholderiales bacterium]|nr:multidrug transporter subunit MdtA [Burkholderiales bacterium]
MNETPPIPTFGCPPRRRVFGRAGPWLLALVVVLAALALWQWKKFRHGAAPGPGAASAASGGFAGGAANRRFGPGNIAQPVSVQAAERRDIRVSVNAIGSI